MRVTILCGMIYGLSILAGGCATSPTSNDEQVPAEQAQADETQLRAQHAMIRNGDQASQKKDYEAAIAFYREAARIKATASIAMRLGYSFQELNKPAQAARNFQAALQLDPDHTMAWHALGQLYLNNKELEQAKQFFQRAIQADPELWRSHAGLGIIEDLSGNGMVGREHYLTAIKISADAPSLWTNFGYSHYLSGNYQEAARAFQHALQLNASYRPAWANYGLVSARLGDYGKAIERLLRVQKEAVAYNDVGYIALLNGDLEQAQHLLDQAIKLSPTYYVQAHENLKKLRTQRNAIALKQIQPVSESTDGAASSAVATSRRSIDMMEIERLISSEPITSVNETQPFDAEPKAQTLTEAVRAPIVKPPAAPLATKVNLTVEPRTPVSFNNEEAKNQSISAARKSQLTLMSCASTVWPSACRLCLSDKDPEACFTASLKARDEYVPRR